jgi:serine/threonine protein kinase
MMKPGDEPIPGYRLEELLGRGQFGHVWRTRAPGKTTLALKFLELTGTHGWKEFRAIQRVKQIRHAHLMPIVGIWLLDEHGQVISDDAIEAIAASQAESDRAASASETLTIESIKQTRRPAQLIVATPLANQTLGERLRECLAVGKPGIPVDELLGYMHEAAKGLDFLNASRHAIGDSLGAVQHCDIKPDNIMLVGGSVVITDFGVAQTLAPARNMATATSLGGTPAYMAPECFMNKPCTTTDQYSLAVTYYELRTGKLPFAAQTYADVFKAHQEGTLDFSSCKPAEQTVLKEATATDPEQRLGSCSEFIDRLTEAVRSERAAAAPRRRRWSGAAALLFLFGAISAAAIFFVVRSLDDAPVAAVPPSEAKVKVTVAVDPADARASVDGNPLPLDREGRALIEWPKGRPLTVQASGAPDRLDGSITITATEEDSGPHQLMLPYSAVYFSKQADRQLADGALDAAAAALASAIKLEPDKYARLPEPTLCSAGSAGVDALSFTLDGGWLAAASGDAVRRWPAGAPGSNYDGELVHRQSERVKELAASEDWTASLAEDGRRIKVSRPGTDAVDLAVPAGRGEVKHIEVVGRGRWLVAATEVLDWLPPVRRAAALHAWDLHADDLTSSYRQLLELDGEFEPRLAAGAQLDWVALATTAGDACVLRKCAVESPTETAILYRQAQRANALAVSRDGRRIALDGGSPTADAALSDYKAVVVDAASGRSQSLGRGHADSISTLALDADGDFLLTGSFDGNAHAWTLPHDWDASTPLAAEPVFLNNAGAVIDQIVCPRAGWAACRFEGKAAMWDCKAGNPAPLLIWTTPAVTALAASADGKWLVTGHEDGTVRWWPVLRLMALERACASAGIPPRAPEGQGDKVTRYDRSSRQAYDYLWGSAETGRPRARRPSAVRGG